MSVHIKRRRTAGGAPRYLVYYRRGGRDYKSTYAGSFVTKREAETRRDIVAGELAAGRDPRVLLASLLRPESRVGLEQRWDEFSASRIDVSGSATDLYRNAKARWVPILGATTDPASVTVEQIQAGVGELVEPSDSKPALKPNTIVHYTSTLRQVLDFADVVPNPAASRKLRLPSQTKDEINPPTTAEWKAILARLPERSQLPFSLIECLGLRISECTALEHGDVDTVDGRVRIARARTKTVAGRRWLSVPDDLLDAIQESQGRRRVFDVSNDQLRYDLRRACKDVAAHGPHDLRHRRVSLWIRMGIDPVTLSRWAGHARSSMSLDTYGHVVIDPAGDVWRDFWLSVYANERSRGEAPVGQESGFGSVS